MNAYELLRENIMNFLHETLKQHPENMPSKWIWHDVFYFDDVNIIKKMLMGAPRNVVQLALKTPYHYLKVDIDFVAFCSFFPCSLTVFHRGRQQKSGNRQ